MIGLWLPFASLSILAISIWYSLQRKVNYWRRQNIELISFWQFLKKLKRQHSALVFSDYYQEMRRTAQPIKALELPLISIVLVQDHQTFKDIMITQYENFPDRGFYVIESDPLTTGLPRLSNEQWKPARQMLSPGFTRAKTKNMFPRAQEISERLVTFLKKRCMEAENGEIEIYDMCARFTIDIIVHVLFGLESNCLTSNHSEFQEYGERSYIHLSNPWKNICSVRFNKLMRFFNVKVFDRESNLFFLRLVRECMEFRERNNIKRQDFMDLLANLKKQNSQSLELIAGHTCNVFLGGFETASCSLAYALYELAKNQEMQQKARKEIQEVLANNSQQITYESLKDMQYLNQIMMETLRKYPVVPYMPRICGRTATVRTTTGSVTLQPDTFVVLPFYGIHHNPEFYPQPEEFRPERFTDEEIAKRPACSFVAFGAGPKSCLAELFGKMEILLGLSTLLSQFRFSLCDKSPEKLIFDPHNLLLLFVKDGIRLKVEKLE